MPEPIVISSNIDEILAALGGLGKDVSASFEYLATDAGNEAQRRTAPITASWTHPEGQFVIEAKAEPLPEVRIMASPLVLMLDAGTRAHEIVPRNAQALAFVWGGPGSYQAKTTPGMLSSQAGGPTGEAVFFKRVWHPGTEPRAWIAQLADDARTWWYVLVEKWLVWALDRIPESGE